MLRIITALPGGGKTTYIYERLRAVLERPEPAVPRQMHLSDSADNPDFSRAVIIVPEQFHFETERILYKKLGAGKIGGVEITSFTKLSAEIVSVYGRAKPYAERAVREIIMLRTLTRLGREKAFSAYTNLNRGVKPDAMLDILCTIEEFQREGISPDELNAAGLSPRLQRKIDDLVKIYTSYSLELGEEYSDRQDDAAKASELALAYGYFSGREIFLDGFDGFTGSQMKLLRTALRTCADMTVTLLADKIPNTGAVYKTAELLFGRLKKTARDFGISTEIVNLSESGGKAPRRPEIYPAFIAKDVYEECDYVAAKINELVIKEKYAFSEIAVIMRDRNPEAMSALNGSFKKYNISAFADIPAPVIEKPLVKFMITAIEAASFKPEKLLLYIKSGFVRIKGFPAGKHLNGGKLKPGYKNPVSISLNVSAGFSLKSVRLNAKTVSLLEEAALKYRLRGKEWRSPFPRGFPGDLEPVRKAVIDPLEEFGRKIKNTTGDKITEALADFLINKMEVQRTVTGMVGRRAGAFKKGFDTDRSLNGEYRQLWEIIISVLEAMRTALLDYPISAEDYTSVLTSVLSRTEIARPPQVLDAVTAGDALRTRTEGCKAAFILGVNRGVFPKSIKSDGMFSSVEIEELLKSGIEISENRAEMYLRERFTVNKALFCPSERLYLSAPLSGLSWNPLEPSPLLSEICTGSITAADLPVSFWACTLAAAEYALALNMDNQTLKEALVLSDADGAERAGILEAARKENPRFHRIDKEAVKKLLDTSVFSPSAIELLNSCAFKFFCDRGLNIKPFTVENETDLNRLQRGNLIHYCLYRVLDEYAVNLIEFTSMKSAQTEALAEQYINEFINSELMSGYGRNERQTAILSSYKPRIATLLDALRRETEASPFKPHAFEENFSYTFANITIAGKTDRYDTYSDGNSTYAAVVDYKTGSNVFDYGALYHGKSLQALLYLYGILEKNPDWLPFGAFYYSEGPGQKTSVTVPEPLDMEAGSNEEIIRSWLESHRHAGIEITGGREPMCGSELDRLENAHKAAARISGRKKYFKKHEISAEDFMILKEHTENLLKSRIQTLQKGEIKALPVKAGTKIPCGYCDYASFCGNGGRFYIKAQSSDMESLFGKGNGNFNENEE